MLSKEEIEKAKEELNNYIIIINKTKDTENEWHGYYNNELHELKRDIETLLQYIEQLERENKKQNKMIDEMSMWIYDKDYNSQDILLLQERYEDYYGNNLKKIKQYFEKKVE